ncbi:alpha/beta hydrolase [Solimonas terrae]|nr:alpha/beta hydrolase [Solimonas terrae]
MTIRRKLRIAFGFVGLLTGMAIVGSAQAAATTPTVVDLWPASVTDHAPTRGPERSGTEGKGLGAVSNISRARMAIYQPAHPNGTTVVIMGGGGYFRIQISNESLPVAQWLNALGVTAAVLYYRLPADGWKAVAPFQDGQRAVRILRAHATEYGIDPHKIGVLGMSAGGNLAGITETRFDDPLYDAVDASDKVSARPDFAALIFPVISLKGALNTTRSRRELNTQSDADDAYSAELHVTHATPPTFLAHAADDPIANVGHSLVMFNALHAAQVPAELHVFEKGGHGWGLGAPGTLVSAWPRLFASWARSHGFMDSARTAAAAKQPAPSDADDAGDDDADDSDGRMRD